MHVLGRALARRTPAAKSQGARLHLSHMVPSRAEVRFCMDGDAGPASDCAATLQLDDGRKVVYFDSEQLEQFPVPCGPHPGARPDKISSDEQ